MAFYVLSNTRIVPYQTTRTGIACDLGGGTELHLSDKEIVDARLFAVHPDENSLCSRSDNGAILYRGNPLIKD